MGTGVEKASQPRLNLSQALRSSILIDRSREEHKQRSEDEREQSGPALSKETTGHRPRGQVTSVILGRVLNAILIEF